MLNSIKMSKDKFVDEVLLSSPFHLWIVRIFTDAVTNFRAYTFDKNHVNTPRDITQNFSHQKSHDKTLIA